VNVSADDRPAPDTHVRCRVEGGIGRVVLSRAKKHNALTSDMVHALLDAIDVAGARDDVKVIVLTGDGPAFCAGFDISDPSQFQSDASASVRTRVTALQQKAAWMRRVLLSPKPLIVSVHHLCIGIGTYLALVADFVVAADDASFGLPEERFGSAGATWAYPFLIREVGIKRASEIVMTGRRFSAQEFHDMGLVNRVVPRLELASTTDSLARALVSLPRDGVALNRAVRAMALTSIGHLGAFDFHGAYHPQAELLRREPDEFDFIARVEAVGLPAAIAERDAAFGADWWGW
jgi:enoyl-CoA hydratase/carnithine racemase